MPDISKLLFHILLLFLMAGGIAGLLAGALLIARPAWLLFVGKRANRWVATRQASSLLKRVIKVDRWFYRHNQVSGTLILAGAIFLIYFFSGHFDKLRIIIGISRAFAISPILSDILLDTAVLSILLGASFALIISLFLLIRPSQLRGFEQGANQWLSLRLAFNPFEYSSAGEEEYMFQNVQMVGVLLLLGSLYTLVWLTNWL